MSINAPAACSEGGSTADRPAYLGFAVKVLGRAGLKSHDTRRWQSAPHLRVSLAHLRALFAYLDEVDVRLYRMASGLVPYATHPDLPQFHGQVTACAAELAEIGDLARRLRLRLSFHPGQYIVLNTPDDDLAARSAADVETHTAVLEAMGLGDEAVVVLHVGGVYGDGPAALERFAARYERLSPAARRRLVVENDDARFSVPDLLWLHQRTGVRLVFDVHHHTCYNPQQMAVGEAVRACLATWRGWAARPKVHFSSPRADRGALPDGRDGACSRAEAAHADYVDPIAFGAFYRVAAAVAQSAGGATQSGSGALPDVVLEAKAKDLAVLQLFRHLPVYAPDVAALLGLKRNTLDVEDSSA